MIRITDQYFWNFVFRLFFIVLVVMGVIILETEARMAWSDLALFDYVLVTLAAWRVVRILNKDQQTRFFREQFLDVKKVGRGYQLVKPKGGPRRMLSDLLDSNWSLSLWPAAVILFLYLLTPYALYPVSFLAISAVASFLTEMSNAVAKKGE